MKHPVLSAALVQVHLGSLDDPANTIGGLLNPTQLRISLGVNIGKLHPVGSSHPVLQYGYTEEAALPLEFYFSTQLQQRLPNAILDLADYVHWFSAFCYPRESGGAPEILYMVWPHVLDMAIVVEKFDAEYTRFYRDTLHASAVRVSINTLEYRISFKTSMDQKTDGFRVADGLIAGGTGNSGRRLRPGR